MILYSFYTGADGGHFATLREAVKDARQLLAEEPDTKEIEIERHTVVPLNKANFIEILNNGGGSWSQESTVVRTIKRGRQ